MDAPAGCTQLFPWEDFEGEPVRYFRGTVDAVIEADRGIFALSVEGAQTTTTVKRVIVLNDAELSPANARRLAEVLLAAAEEVDDSRARASKVVALATTTRVSGHPR